MAMPLSLRKYFIIFLLLNYNLAIAEPPPPKKRTCLKVWVTIGLTVFFGTAAYLAFGQNEEYLAKLTKEPDFKKWEQKAVEEFHEWLTKNYDKASPPIEINFFGQSHVDMNDKYNSNTIEFQYKILRYLQNEAKNNPTIFVERHSSDLDKVSRARTESITSWKVFDGMERVSLIPEIPKTFPIGIPKVDLNKWTAQQKHSLTVLGAADLLFYSKEIDEIKAGTDDETLSQAIKTY
jgi:hypothetical protein